MRQTEQVTVPPTKGNDGNAEPRPFIDRHLHVADGLRAGTLRLSAVIPLFNEDENIGLLYQRLKAVLLALAPNHEIIFVNDGSNDGSLERLKALLWEDDQVKLVSFRRNFGKAAALAAGFRIVTGDYVLMMDADLQDQPEELPKLIDAMDEGFDLVTGWKRVRHDPIHKTLPSKLFNKTVSRTFGIHIHDFNCGYKMMRAEVAKSLRLYGDFHRFIPVLAHDLGYTVTERAVEHAPRVHGYSKYGGKRLITGLLDFLATIAVTKFFHKPMQFFGGVAVRIFGLAFAIGLFLSYHAIFGSSNFRPLWIVFCVLVLGAIQILTTGLVAELLVNSTRRDERETDVARAQILRASPETYDSATML